MKASKYPISISVTGSVILGPDLVCDGFHFERKARVQTHIHDDHMFDFDRSKQFQNVYLTQATYDLLLAEYNADLIFRTRDRGNFFLANHGQKISINDSTLELVSSNHMLGSAQVAIEYKNGLRLGYSSDFSWPIDKVIEVEALVVDSTAGPKTKREFSQDEIEAMFIDLVMSKPPLGPVYIKAHRGTLQRSMQALSGIFDNPVVGSERLCREVEVYQKHGYGIRPLIDVKSEEGIQILKESNYIRFFGKGDRMPIDSGKATTIILSAYMTQPDQPILEFSDRSYRVAISNHADFKDTLEYVKASGAKYVITDNSRNGHAFELASEIRTRFGIEAIAAECTCSHEWGQ